MCEIIDFHAHILPGADHGSDGIETSRAQLDILKGCGVGAVVATPHFYPEKESVASFLDKRRAAAQELRTVLKDGDPKVYLGAEVLVCPGLDRMDSLSELCIEGTNVLLLEMPFTKWNAALIEAVSNISQRDDITVVMAHINRYSRESSMALLREADVLLQLNSESMSTFSGRRRFSWWLEDEGVAAFGSDIHMKDKQALQSFNKIFKKYYARANAVMEMTNELLLGAKML